MTLEVASPAAVEWRIQVICRKAGIEDADGVGRRVGRAPEVATRNRPSRKRAHEGHDGVSGRVGDK